MIAVYYIVDFLQVLGWQGLFNVDWKKEEKAVDFKLSLKNIREKWNQWRLICFIFNANSTQVLSNWWIDGFLDLQSSPLQVFFFFYFWAVWAISLVPTQVPQHENLTGSTFINVGHLLIYWYTMHIVYVLRSCTWICHTGERTFETYGKSFSCSFLRRV